MDDFKPFLQIVHISDLHVVDPRSSNSVSVRDQIRKLRKLLPKVIVDAIAEGVAAHDPRAVGLFKEFLREITAADPVWSKCKTWLVDTGDLTSLGDQNSLKLGRQYLADFGKICPEMASIYGNHDAWPGSVPIWMSGKQMAAQSQTLTSLKYTVAAPGLLLRMPIPHGNGEVQLYFVDSIRHNPWHNLRALGEVSDPQLDALRNLVDQSHNAERRDFRILAVHHPVHYPPPRPQLQMSMSNDSDVAKVLDKPSPQGAYPLAHLVLSGHTHCLYPEHGKLPVQPSQCLHPDLGSDQCQFVVGSLTQFDRCSKREGSPHQCEVLRMYYSESDHSVLSLERLLAARSSGRDNHRGTGIGPYSFVPLRGQTKIEEEITFTMQ